MTDTSYGKEQEQRGLADDVPAEIIDAEPVDARNAESSADIGMALQIYQKVGIVPFETAVQTVLAKYERATADNGLLQAYDILPTGELYLPQVHYRRILNEAFGRGGWAPVPLDPKPYVRNDGPASTSQLVQEWALICHGRFVSQAEGGAEYNPSNARQMWSDACETVKSNALMRCCKELSLASDCWDKRFIEVWRREHAIQVWVQKWRKDGNQWKVVEAQIQWRRAAADPVAKEIRPVAEGETKIWLDDKGNELPKSSSQQKPDTKPEPKPPVQSPDKAVAAQSGSLPTSQPADPERQPLLAIAQKAGRGGYFTARGVTIVEVKRTARKDKDGNPKKNGAGEIAYTYGGKTDNGEWITFFSTSDANALNKAAQEKRTVDLQCKAALKGEKWFINLEEIVGEA